MATIRPIPREQVLDLYRLIRDHREERMASWLGFSLSDGDLARQTVGDPDFEPNLLLGAYEGSIVTGAVMGIRRTWKPGKEHTAFIKWVYVSPDRRREGLGRRLIDHIETTFREAGVTRLAYGSSAPLYLFPGAPDEDMALHRLLASAGWTRGSERISLCANLVPEKEDPSIEEDERHRMHCAGELDRDRVIRFVQDHFSSSWAREIEPAFDETCPAICCILVDERNQNLIGFCAVGATNPGWLGPMGMMKNQRGKGWGQRLLRYTLRTAQQSGLHRMMFPWINENEAFYRKVLEAPSRLVFHKFEKRL